VGSIKETIVFNGITFVRYPNAKTLTARRYFAPYVGAKRAKGVSLLHREIWKSVHGEIPKGWHIHHKDGNPLNNDIENLECVSPKTHSGIHAPEYSESRRQWLNSIRDKTADWHSSDDGRKWHSQHAKDIYSEREARKFDCAQCGREFESKDYRRGLRFCSRACVNKHNDSTSRYAKETTCVICGKTFVSSARPVSPCCSRSCGVTLGHRNRKR
jgi:hypothetical protein